MIEKSTRRWKTKAYWVWKKKHCKIKKSCIIIIINHFHLQNPVYNDLESSFEEAILKTYFLRKEFWNYEFKQKIGKL